MTTAVPPDPSISMVEVKICGISTADGLEAAYRHGADMVGFVFFEKSPRAIDPVDAAAVMDGLPHADEGGPLRVGLLVDPEDQLLDLVLSQTRLDMLQLHGSESPERTAMISAAWGIPVMKALPIAEAADLDRCADYTEAADRLLLDAKPPPGADRPGGHATAFDWTLLSGWQAPMPWMLAGGLTPDTVGEAIAVTGAPGVDVSSGVESAPGIKDAERIAAFIDAVNRARMEA